MRAGRDALGTAGRHFKQLLIGVCQPGIPATTVGVPALPWALPIGLGAAVHRKPSVRCAENAVTVTVTVTVIPPGYQVISRSGLFP